MTPTYLMTPTYADVGAIHRRPAGVVAGSLEVLGAQDVDIEEE